MKIPIELFCLTGNETNDTWAGSLASLTFGGTDLDILYVTTLIGNQPTPIPVTTLDGHLFSVHGLGVRGLPSRRFAG